MDANVQSQTLGTERTFTSDLTYEDDYQKREERRNEGATKNLNFNSRRFK